MHRASVAFAILSTCLPSMVVAQETGAPTAAQRRAEDAKRPDTPGSGSTPAIKETDPSLPDHVIYRPANLAALNAKRLGVLLWGNGGCSADGASARFHLSEIASHGYVVIAPGRIMSGPDAADAASRQDRRPNQTNGQLPPAATTSQDLLSALDWIFAENSRKGSRYQGLIDPAQVAVAGHSCGGLQALQVAADPRIKAVIVNNSGVFTDGANPIPGIKVNKAMLGSIHSPILYVMGGKGDVAWHNGTDDFVRISGVPAVLIDGDVGHGGTFGAPNGGDVARFSVAWLNWRLRGDARAGRMFKGADCGLCNDPKWRLQRKGL